MLQEVDFGGVGERLKPAVLKTVRPERVSWVRIPPPPPLVFSLGNHDLQPNSNALLLQNLFSKSHATAEVAGPSSYFAEVAASKPSKWAGFSQLISLISASVIPAPLSAAIYIFHPSTKGG